MSIVKALSALRDINRMVTEFDTPRDPARVMAFVGDVGNLADKGWNATAEATERELLDAFEVLASQHGWQFLANRRGVNVAGETEFYTTLIKLPPRRN